VTPNRPDLSRLVGTRTSTAACCVMTATHVAPRFSARCKVV
jgi:hypothetical protein